MQLVIENLDANASTEIDAGSTKGVTILQAIVDQHPLTSFKTAIQAMKDGRNFDIEHDSMECSIYAAKLKWTVEFEVSTRWVQDGFDFTDERALDMLAEDLSSATSVELGAKVLTAPDPSVIREVQGYKD